MRPHCTDGSMHDGATKKIHGTGLQPMTAARADLKGLPDWPRGLSRDQAAAYVGISVGLFDRKIAPRVPCLLIGARKLWDRTVLDRYLDAYGTSDQHETKEEALGRLDDGNSRARC